MNSNRHIVFGLTILTIGLIVCSLIGSWTVLKVKRANDIITVTGSAKRPIESDYIVWNGSISTRQPTMERGYDNMKIYSERLRSFFREEGLPDSVITINSITSYSIPEIGDNGGETGGIAAYNLSQRFSVRSDDIDRIEAIIAKADELMSKGVPLSSHPPQYLYTKLSDLRIDLLADAAKDAQKRARQMAGSAGQKVGVLKSAKMGVFQVTARHSTEVSDYGRYDTSTKDKDVTAVVRMSFALE